MNVYGLTDRGLVREANEDCIGITCLKNGITIAVVCDGMGGAAGGKIASEIAENTFMSSTVSFCETLNKDNFDSKNLKAAIEESVQKANAAILEKAREDLSLFGMGCTLNALVFCDFKSKIYYANVGDSRLYKITSKKIKQLTKDHSYVQMLLDNREITEEEAEHHPNKNLITKALGIKDEIEPDIDSAKVAKATDEYYLLCSDGLHGMLDKDMLQYIAISDSTIEEKVFTYIRLANEAGGIDNISAILLNTKETEVAK